MSLISIGFPSFILVASNEIPGEMAALCAAARDCDWARARILHDRWLPLFRANFRGGPNPVPVKSALAMMGLIEDRLRLPLLPLDEPARGRLAALLHRDGLLEAQSSAAAGVGEGAA